MRMFVFICAAFFYNNNHNNGNECERVFYYWINSCCLEVRTCLHNLSSLSSFHNENANKIVYEIEKLFNRTFQS